MQRVNAWRHGETISSRSSRPSASWWDLMIMIRTYFHFTRLNFQHQTLSFRPWPLYNMYAKSIQLVFSWSSINIYTYIYIYIICNFWERGVSCFVITPFFFVVQTCNLKLWVVDRSRSLYAMYIYIYIYKKDRFYFWWNRKNYIPRAPDPWRSGKISWLLL